MSLQEWLWNDCHIGRQGYQVNAYSNSHYISIPHHSTVIAGMTLEWLPYREAGVSSCFLSNDDRMTEWQRNDRHFWIKVNPLDFFWGTFRPIRGLDFELSTNRKAPFWQFSLLSSIFITAILSSSRHSTIILSFKSHSISLHSIPHHSTVILYHCRNDFGMIAI